jgi:lysophospholipase L1-like esterase
LRKALLAAMLLVALTACVDNMGPGDTPLLGESPAVLAESPPSGGPVLAIGDSIMVGANDHGHLGAILTLDGWELETIAENGRTVSWAIGEIEERDARVPRNVVVALGSNPGFSSDGFAEDVLALRDLLVTLGARRIVWLPPYHTDPNRYAEKIAVLAAADEADRRIVVPNWGAVLDAHPEWVRGDGIHLTEDGYTAMAAFIRDWL